jgi:hypothetical protein
VIGGNGPVGVTRLGCGGPSGLPSFRLRTARRRCTDERTVRRQERLVGAGKPHGSFGSLADPTVPDRTDPEAPSRSVPLHGGPRRAEAREGDCGDAGCRDGTGWSAPKGDAPGPRYGRRPMSAPGDMSFERSGVSVFLTSCSSELGERKPCGKGSRSGASTATWRCRGSVAEEASDQRKNPMDGSGPRGRKASGEQTVEEVRNLEDGPSPGEAIPGSCGPARLCRRRGVKPQEGMVPAVRLDPEPRRSALRGAQA